MSLVRGDERDGGRESERDGGSGTKMEARRHVGLGRCDIGAILDGQSGNVITR